MEIDFAALFTFAFLIILLVILLVLKYIIGNRKCPICGHQMVQYYDPITDKVMWECNNCGYRM